MAFEVSYGPQDFTPTRGLVQGATQKVFATSSTNRHAFAFDDSTQEGVTSKPFIAPDTTTASGVLKCELKISAASDTTNTAAFQVGLECITDADSLNLTTADSFDTTSTGSVTLSGTAGDQHKIEVTIANTDGLTAGDQVRLSIARDTPTADTASGDLYLYAARLYQEAT